MTRPRSFRFAASLLAALEERARDRGETASAVAERYLEEAIRAADHPGVLFRDGPAGRRAAVAGGPDVWEIVGSFLAEGSDASAAADYLSLPVGLVNVAVGYYAEYPEEVNAWLERNQALADEAEARFRRRGA